MLDKIENAFRGLVNALQIAKLYGADHQKVGKFLETANERLQEVLAQRPELVIGIVGDELAFEKEILFDLSRSIQPMIAYLKSRGVEKVAFYRGLTSEELSKFVSFLMLPKDEYKKEPQEYLDAAGVRNISVGRLKGSGGGDGGQQPEEVVQAVDFLNIYNGSLDNFSQSMENVLDAKDMDYINLRFNITNMMETMVGRHQELLKLAAVKRYDVNTFVHTMNVSILSMFFASRLGLAKEDILDIGIAALFHDIGKVYISRNIIKKTDKLTDEEFSTVKGHTVFGAEILLKYVDTLGMLPVLVAFEHHLKPDFKGYPKMAFPHKPHPGSIIVSICDIYDALLQRRSYKSPYPPDMVHDIMMKSRDNVFDPGLLDTFFKIMGVWPIGTMLALSDKSVAVVRDENEDDKFLPKVEIIHPAENRKMVDLRETKGSIAIEKFIDPQTEGKVYSSLI